MPKLTPRLHPEVRARLEAAEELLSPFAARSRLSRGRQRPEEESPTRTAFQRDRDRVVHCKAFRRLKHKTQVFIAPLGDHYRTRLTHTLEVAQVARSLARALRLNEDLTEAIALAHDLGHTPFGHAGEQALNELLPGGFRHHEQSLRVVDLLEKNGQGLNLTQEVRDGILTHSKTRDSIEAGVLPAALTLEGQVVKLSDSIAYINHDLEDAVRAGVLRPEDIPASILEPLGRTTAERIDTLVMDVVDTNWAIAEAEGPPRPPTGIVLQLSPAASAAANALRDFLFTRVYRDALALAESEKARHVVAALFEHFCKHPEQLPAEIGANPRGEPAERLVADHIAGMTDRYAIRLFEELYVPRLWTALGGVG